MIVLDTSFIVSYKVENDENHEKALRAMKDIGEGKYGQVAVSDYIFDETVTVILMRSKSLPLAVGTGEDMKKYFNIERIETEIFNGAWDIFSGQKVTNFSFTDCTTLSLMKRMKIRHIATFDSDFDKAEGIEKVC